MPCDCTPGDRRACWNPDLPGRATGMCTDGAQSCSLLGQWSACEGAVEPATDVACDALDQDCNGSDAGGESCRRCADHETCANGLDDDCDGVRDDPSVCGFTCVGVNPELRPELACCLDPTRPAYSFDCVEVPGAPACRTSERRCVDVDGDPATRCMKDCGTSGCRCGERGPDGFPVPTPRCGFEVPCAFRDCDGRLHQPCYSGPPETLGVGACHGGFSDCTADGGKAWGECAGEVLPRPEICGNGVDDDCDGRIDEEDASGRRCVADAGCRIEELCGNGQDDDCDGFADEACPASGRQACYTGPPPTRRIGACQDGEQQEVGGFWGDCDGDVRPAPEICGDGVDGDCDGSSGPGDPEDEGCCVPSAETCNGLDDDCDGLPDDGVVSHCGRCDGTPCDAFDFGELADCDVPGRACIRIAPAAQNGITRGLDDGILSTPEILLPYPYGPSQGLRVRYLDTARGTLGDPIDVGNIGTQFPVALAMALDGSFWVHAGGGLQHRGRDGALLCTFAPSPLVTGSVVPDPFGGAWLVFPGTLIRIDDDCREVDLDPTASIVRPSFAGDAPAALAGYGILWASSNGGLARLDTGTLSAQKVPLSGTAFSIVGDRDGSAWLHDGRRIAGSGPYDDPASYVTSFDGVFFDWPLLASDGRILGDDGLGGLVVLDPATGRVDHPEGPDGGLRSVYFNLLDDQDRIWATVPGMQTSLFRWDGTWSEVKGIIHPSGGWHVDRQVLGRTHLRRLARQRARWSQIVHASEAAERFRQLTWSADEPGASRIRVTVRLAQRASELDAQWRPCTLPGNGTIDLRACAAGLPYRVARVEVELDADASGSAPVLRELRLTSDRP